MDLSVGDIIIIQNDEIHPPNQKYSLCVLVNTDGIFSNYNFFLINSLDRKIYNSFPIYKKNHDFLKKDSFIGCNNLYEYSQQGIEQQGYKWKSRIGFEELKDLIKHVKDSRTISQNMKTSIISSLEDLLNEML